MTRASRRGIHPIQTRYNGYHFRSRLEARWAVYFDTIGLKYDYEPEGFHLDGLNYLPDFWFPEKESFGEVKPVPFTEAETEKARRLVTTTQKSLVRLIGTPAVQSYPWNRASNFIEVSRYLDFVVHCLPVYFTHVPDYSEIEALAADLSLNSVWTTDESVFVSSASDPEFDFLPWPSDFGSSHVRDLPPPDVFAGVEAARSARFGT